MMPNHEDWRTGGNQSRVETDVVDARRGESDEGLQRRDDGSVGVGGDEAVHV